MINTTQLGKIYIKNTPQANLKKLCSFTLNNDILGNLTVETKRYKDETYKFITELKNEKGNLFGKEVFAIEANSKKLQGFYIETNPKYRKTQYRFGELLRLSSIIEMLENGLSTFEIYSKDTAIYFHSKYKFIPDIKNFLDRDKALESIIENSQPGFEQFVQKALKILNAIKKTNSASIQRDLRSKTNELTLEYIQKVLENKDAYKSHPFKFGMNMQLTDKQILDNKNFFNELFKKHGIDFKI